MVAGGKCVLDACRRLRVSRATFYRWRDSRPDVAAMYQQACRARLATVENELESVRREIARIRATVPDERPRGGVYFGEFIRAIRNPLTPAVILERMHPRTSRRDYRRMRHKMWREVRWMYEWQDVLKLERARLLGRVARCPAVDSV